MKIIKDTDKWIKEYVNMFGESEKVLEKLFDGRVFEITIFEDSNKIGIGEMCDEYFGEYLSSEELRDLAVIFNGLADYKDSNENIE